MRVKNFFLNIFFVFLIIYSGRSYKPKNVFLCSLKEIFNINPKDFFNIFGIYKSSFYKLEGNEVEEVIIKRIEKLNTKIKNDDVLDKIRFLEKSLKQVKKQNKIEIFFKKKREERKEIDFDLLKLGLAKRSKKIQKKITDYFVPKKESQKLFADENLNNKKNIKPVMMEIEMINGKQVTQFELNEKPKNKKNKIFQESISEFEKNNFSKMMEIEMINGEKTTFNKPMMQIKENINPNNEKIKINKLFEMMQINPNNGSQIMQIEKIEGKRINFEF